MQERSLAVQERASSRASVAIAHGDGIGPEIIESTLKIVEAAGAKLDIHRVEMGEQVYRRGISSGIAQRDLDTLARTGVLLKAPITTPQGGGHKSLNVTIRKSFGLYANVRPCKALAPYVRTLHPDMDVVIIRENEEDVYGGIEHRQTDDVTQCLKLITRSGCERIIRYAFEYARANGRSRVSCFTKDNIMKITDGLFHRVFDEIATEYPEIENNHLIVDIGAARLATQPEQFDVIVLPNLYGDILSDVAAELCGSVGMAGSANIGDGFAMFEAIHGSAPDIAGTGTANPSGLLNAAVMMLAHVGQVDVAQSVHDAWLRAIEDGVHTRDIFGQHSIGCYGTRAFTAEVIARLGMQPRKLKRQRISAPIRLQPAKATNSDRRPGKKTRQGVDIFVDWSGEPDVLAASLQALRVPSLTLSMISNRGTKVWPGGNPQTRCVDHWRCRFSGDAPTARDVVATISAVAEAGYDVIKMEGLYAFDGNAGYSLGQGQ